MEQIPALGSTYLHHPAWYNTPKLLLHLSFPIQELIKDPRSTVVRRVCVALTTLFHRCQSDARLLFKDLMHTVLIVQGQTVQTIRNAVSTMIVDVIPQVPCKSVMPFWMERLKDKSPTIRDACSLYLGIALQSWSSMDHENYLTDEIWYQVGTALIKTLRDPSPNVRQQTKQTLIYMQHQYPSRWETLIHDPNGPAAKDTKLLLWLNSLSGMSHGGADDAMDDLSVASKYTYNSESRFAASNNNIRSANYTNAVTTTAISNPIRISSPRLLKLQTNKLVNTDDASSIGGRSSLIQQPPQSSRNSAIPFSIAVTTTGSATTVTGSKSVLPPDPPEIKGPLRRANPTNNSTTSTTNETFTPGRNSGTPPRPKNTSMAVVPKPPSTPQAQTYSALALQASNDEDDNPNDETNFEYSESQNSHDPIAPTVSLPDSPFIASMHELKKHASQRRSRNSIVMQERFKQQQQQMNSTTPTSSRDSTTVETHASEMENQPRHGNQDEAKILSNHDSSKAISSTAATPKPKESDALSANGNNGTPSSTQPPPEHIVIAIRLLRAHKSHVDQIMETLKLEMDTLRDFDRLLESPGRPTEEELITYYESMDLCVQQRDNANRTLRNEMDQLSTGGVDGGT